MDCKKIGEYIQSKRKAKKLTQAQLSEMLGITSKAVSKWETGVAIPDIGLFPDLAKILNVTVDELLIGEDIEKVQARKRISLNIILSIIIVLLIIFICCLLIHFNNNYAKVKVYKIESANKEFLVDGSLMTIDDKSYLSIKNIEYLGNELDLLEEVNNFKYEIYYGEELLFNGEIKNPHSEFYLKDYMFEFLSSTEIKNKKVFESSDYSGRDYFTLKFICLDFSNQFKYIHINLKVVKSK